MKNVETIVFDEGQITCPTNANKPQWNDPCHSITLNAGRTVVIMREKDDMASKSNEGVLILNDQGGSIMNVSEGQVSTLRAQEHGHQPLVYENHSQDSRYKELGDVSETMSAKYGTGGNNQPLVVSQPDPVCIGNGQLDQLRMMDKVGTLNCMHDQQAVLSYGLDRASYNQGKNAQFDFSIEEEQQPTLTAKGPGAVMKSKVRRLTPEECEALQGFPRYWTVIGEPQEVEITDYDIQYDDEGNEVSKTPIGTHKEIQYFYTDENGKKKRCADSTRYKALGNSIAVGYANHQSGFWMWLMKRISATYERSATLGSLFDGIGGFPLAWEFYNGKGSALWASEIEDFPIKVTKERFKEE